MKKLILFTVVFAMFATVGMAETIRTKVPVPGLPDVYRVWRNDVVGYEGTFQPISPNLMRVNENGALVPHQVTITDLPGGLKGYSIGPAWEE